MNFNIEDPLADILSDGSDDSFFDDDILGKKKSTKKNILSEKNKTPTAALADKKNSLFNLESDTKINENIDDFNKSNASKTIISQSPYKRMSSQDSVILSSDVTKTLTKQPSFKVDTAKSLAETKGSSSVEQLDIFSDKLVEPKTEISKTLERGKSSQSLLDDILGSSLSKSGTAAQQSRPVTAAKSQEFDFNSILGKSESKPVVAQKNNKLQKDMSSEIISKDEVQPRKTKSSEDWLGVFQNKNDASESDNTGMPSWLLGTDTKKNKTIEEGRKSKPDENVASVKPDELNILKENITQNKNKIDASPDINKNLEEISFRNSASIMNRQEDVTTEGAALYLQQQEAQLMIALQLKAQEEKLAALQMRQEDSQRIQREASRARAAQVDALLQRQAAQRAQMQAAIAKHQERINMRIKALLGSTADEESNIDGHDTNFDNPKSRNDSPSAKEKQQLLGLIQSLQENHDKEVDLMESSYRRQLAFIEISLSQSEERMKEDMAKQMKYYMEKIEWLEEHHKSYRSITEESIKTLTERHNTETTLLREQHLDNINSLQEHHTALMENIKNAVKQEQTLITDSVGFSSNLHELVDEVKESKNLCQTLVQNVQEIAERMQKQTDSSIQTREAQINEMIQQLKRERENFDVEKNENREIAKLLEARLKQMTQLVEEEAASLKQKRMEFEFEKATFSKQTEFAKNVLKKQEEEIKMIKEDIQKEYQDKITKIEEEKSKILKDSSISAKERSAVHNLRQELENLKSDLQSQLEELSEERSKLNLEKQQMHMEEQRILAKSRDIELLAKTAVEKQTQADNKYSEAEFIRKKYEERIRRIQEQVVSLNDREKQIAREKVTLSRERLSLHNERREIEGKQCSLCKSMQHATHYNYEDNYTIPEYLKVSRDFGNANVSVAMDSIENEMAHLLSRNMGLRNIVSSQNQDVGLTMDNSNPIERITDLDDPKLLLLRLDVEKVISNLDQNAEEKAEEK